MPSHRTPAAASPASTEGPMGTPSPEHASEQHPRRSRARRIAWWSTLGAAVVAIGIAAAVVYSVMPWRSPGALFAQLTGHIVVNDYATAADAPAGVLPEWTPAAARSITVLTPGADTGNVGTALSATVDGVAVPDLCEPSPAYSQPWIFDGSWPDYTESDILQCDGWSMIVRGDQWYVWTPDTRR